jgi:hypothetical protein
MSETSKRRKCDAALAAVPEWDDTAGTRVTRRGRRPTMCEAFVRRRIVAS